MSDKPNKSRRSGADRERAAKMRAAYTNPYKTVTAAERRIKNDLYEERDSQRQSSQEKRERRERREGREIPGDVVQRALQNPTKFVSEAELREQYHHVLTDLRNMATLSAALIVVLVVLAFVLPR